MTFKLIWMKTTYGSILTAVNDLSIRSPECAIRWMLAFSPTTVGIGLAMHPSRNVSNKRNRMTTAQFKKMIYWFHWMQLLA